MGLDRTALGALRLWKFEPARQGGLPIRAWHEVQLIFEIAPQDMPDLSQRF